MYKLSLAVLAAVFILMGCRKNRFGDFKTETVTVRVLYPETYSQPNASGTEVTLTSALDGSIKIATTNSAGLAVFSNVLPGTYSLAASRTLTPAEAQPLTGFAAEVRLNAIRSGLNIATGTNPAFELRLQGSRAGALVIKEVYYTASRTPAGGNYFSDQ
ncbi:MAG: carboxypeptidase regulatory-like domain-containing protein, partial [Bacteroidetes bacterium]